MLYGLAGLICLLLVWFNIWPGADVIRTGDHDVLVSAYSGHLAKEGQRVTNNTLR